MNPLNVPFRSVLALSAGLLLSATASAAFSLFDNFDAYATGPLNGQGPVGNVWTAISTTNVELMSGIDKVANLPSGTGGGPNYRSLVPAGLSIANSSAAATVHFNFTLSATGTANNFNFIVTDDAAPADTAGSSEVQFNFDGAAGNLFRARSGGGFKFLSLDGTAAGNLTPLANVEYNGYFVINNLADTYQFYLQSAAVPALASPTQLLANDGTGGTFGFRNGAASNALTTVNFGSASSGSVVRYDDIYVDTAGANLANPVPEPSVALVGSLGMLGLLLRRRRA